MRKCLRCENEMVENLEVKVSNGSYGIDVREKGLFKNALEKIKCAVCPECGYTETYIENPDKIKELIEKENVKLSTNHLEDNNSIGLKGDIDYSENNQVTLVGKATGEKKFSHEIYGEKFYTFDLSIPRLSGIVDIIPITIAENLINDENLTEDDKIYVKGQIRGYNIYENERNKLVLTIFAKEIEAYREGETTNEVVLIGFVCKKPIYRQTPFGRNITDLLLAVDRAYNKSDYIPAIAWGRNAILCQELRVGTQVKIVGRVQSRECEKRFEDGTTEKRVACEVSITSLEVIN